MTNVVKLQGVLVTHGFVVHGFASHGFFKGFISSFLTVHYLILTVFSEFKKKKISTFAICAPSVTRKMFSKVGPIRLLYMANFWPCFQLQLRYLGISCKIWPYKSLIFARHYLFVNKIKILVTKQLFLPLQNWDKCVSLIFFPFSKKLTYRWSRTVGVIRL